MGDGKLFWKRLKSSFGLKIVIIGFMLLVFLIPISLIKDLVSERSGRSFSVEQDIIGTWGGEPVLAGPILIIPFQTQREFYNEEKERVESVWVDDVIYVFPEQLEIDGNVDVQQRTRGIYSVPVFSSEMNIYGSFALEDVWKELEGERIQWDDIRFSMSMSTLKGIVDAGPLDFDGQKIPFNTGSGFMSSYPGEIQCPLDLTGSPKSFSYNFDLNFNGGRSLKFVPLGKTTRVHLESNWDSPSFFGSYLPTERELTEQGFSSEWTISYLSRSLPLFQKAKEFHPESFYNWEFGVLLRNVVSIYLKSERSVKFSWLFLIVPFLTFILFELIYKYRIHPVQYFLAGAADILFYMLLLSISEHLGFNLAYLVGAAAVTVLVSLYTLLIVNKDKKGLVMFPVLSLSYFFLYIVLQSEDYALLLGSVGLFAVIGFIMFLTRKIQWYKKGDDDGIV